MRPEAAVPTGQLFALKDKPALTHPDHAAALSVGTDSGARLAASASAGWYWPAPRR